MLVISIDQHILGNSKDRKPIFNTVQSIFFVFLCTKDEVTCVQKTKIESG